MVWTLLLAGCIEQSIVGPAIPDPLGPRISVDPTELEFGAPLPGEEVLRTFTISSVGDETLRVAAVECQDDRFAVHLDPTDLPVGEAIDVEVTYLADGTGQGAQATVHSDDRDHAVVGVDLVVADREGVLRIEPNPVDFGAADIGESVDRFATLWNVGEGPLTIDAWRIDDEEFFIVSPPDLPLTLDADDDVDLRLSFAPLALGSDHLGALIVDSNAIATDSPVTLIGTTTR